MIAFLDLPRQYQQIKPEIDDAIASIVQRGAFIGGSAVSQFESQFAKYQDAEHCVGVGNGTDAIEIAIEALSLPPNSEIIVPANSFVASSEAVTRSGHEVVFADIDHSTYLIDPDDVARRITPATAAIMAVHLYGQPAEMDRLCEIAEKHGLKILEDCAQAHGAEFDGQRVGTIGDIGTFSFYPGKNLGAYGDAGAIVTDDPDLARRCRMIANHGRVEKYNHEFEGRNSRLDALQAAVLSVKLKKLDEWIELRNVVARAYSRTLAGVSGIVAPHERTGVRHSYHLYVVQVEKRDALRQFLSDHEIQSGVHYPIALPKLSAYANHKQSEEDMVATRLDRALLSLPIGEHLREEDAYFVCEKIKSFLSS